MSLDLDFFEVEQPSLIDQGGSAGVYAIQNGLAVKFYHGFSSLMKIIKEFKVCEKLYLNGINVPKPKGVFEVNLENRTGPGFIMERIGGIKGCYVRSPHNELVKNLLNQELNRAKEKKIYPGVDSYFLYNCIYQPENNKVYLIDFESWHI